MIWQANGDTMNRAGKKGLLGGRPEFDYFPPKLLVRLRVTYCLITTSSISVCCDDDGYKKLENTNKKPREFHF